MTGDNQPRVVAILPSPGMGHLIPMLEFGKRLVHQHHIHVKLIISGDKSLQDELALTSIDAVHLPPVQLDDMPKDAKIETRISITVARSLPSLREVLKSLMTSTHVVALVVDLFGTDAFDIAEEVGVDAYIFYPSTAMALSLFLHLPELDRVISGEYWEMREPIKLPGCIPIAGNELLDPTQDRKNDAYKWLLHHCKRYKMAKGIIVNTFPGLEEGALRGLVKAEKDGDSPFIYPVGPIVRTGKVAKAECLMWLDEHPKGSVLYVCAGSGGTLNREQLKELALGLEMSGQRFLWVMRIPSNEKRDAAFFTAGEKGKNPLAFLPSGFIERTRGVGLVVPSWAPQASILAHPSTGGFLSHCGWNSVLESVVNGVPLIAWPLYAEQKMNARMLVDDIKIAIRPEVNKEGVVEHSEIAKVVRYLLEGEEGKALRIRIMWLQQASMEATASGGRSTLAMAELVSKWKTSQLPSYTSANDISVPLPFSQVHCSKHPTASTLESLCKIPS